MKRIMLVCSCLLLLTACFYSKEAKQIKNSEEIQGEMETAIKKQAKDKYGMDVHVYMKQLKFTFPKGKLLIPLKTDKRLIVPVETIGTPSYEFPVYISIYDEAQETYQFKEDQLDLTELPKMGTVFLTDIFKDEYKAELDKLVEFDEDMEIKVEVEAHFANRYFEDKKEEATLLKDFASDYHAGKFVDPKQYKALIKKHAALPNEHSKFYEEELKGAQPCTPHITLNIEHEEDLEQTGTERLAAISDFIETEPTLPNGWYSVHLQEEDSDNPAKTESGYESVLRCDE